MTTTTRSDSDERLAKTPQNSEKASIFGDGFSQDSLKVVSFPPLEKDSVLEMMSSKKEVKSSPFASVPEKDEETISSDSAEASFSKELEAIYVVDCPEVSSVPETTTSAFLEEDKIGEEMKLVKETSASNISEVGEEKEEGVEGDGSVVCISEKKGQEDSKVLDAEKKRLLAEVETGTILRKKDDVGTFAMASHVHQKVERVRVKDNAFVGRSVNIDLVDDTALLNVVPFSKKAKDHPKDAPRKHKKNVVGGGKQQDKKGYAATELSETSGNQMRIVYSTNQMKSMRYAHSANQKKLWSDVYARLLPELVAEYEGLVSFKTSKSNMRESGNGILGHVSAVPRRNRVNIFVH